MKCLTLLLALGLLAPAAPADTLKVCLNDVPHMPWRLPDAQNRVTRTGLDFVFLDLLAKRADIRIEVELLPWKRCMADIKIGLQDAIQGISYLPEREELGHYPQIASQPDETLAVRRDQYAWYAPVGADLRWDGKHLHGLPAEALVGVQSGYSIAGTVKGLGFKVDEAARTAESNLTKLARGRVAAAALQAREADRVLATKPALAQAVQRLNPMLQERPYYMIFSRNYVARSKRPLPLWWRDVVWVRDSPAYRKAEAEALSHMDDLP